MTALELTTWAGVDHGGPFILMFGHIDTAATPDIMNWSRIGPDGKIQGFGTASHVDADTFTVGGDDRATLISNAINGACDFSIASAVLTLVMDGKTLKVRQET